MVGAQHVLTARNCVEGIDVGGIEIYSGFDPFGGDGDVLAFAGDVAEARFPEDVDADMAMLITSVDLGLDPLPFSRDEDDRAIGSEVRAVGYGQYTDDEGDDRKRSGTGWVDDHHGTVFLTTANTCFGDSGGPAFDLGGTIVGVTSGGTEEACSAGQDIYTAVGWYSDWIDTELGNEVPEPDPLGETGSSCKAKLERSVAGISVKSCGNETVFNYYSCESCDRYMEVTLRQLVLKLVKADTERALLRRLSAVGKKRTMDRSPLTIRKARSRSTWRPEGTEGLTGTAG